MLRRPRGPRPPQIQGPLQVARRSDMDMNGHINNVTYLAWVLESVPAPVYQGYRLREVRIPCAGGEACRNLNLLCVCPSTRMCTYVCLCVGGACGRAT